MTLAGWQNNGWLRPHRSSRREIEGLFSIVDRDLVDATPSDLSSDWKFGITYNAGLRLCTILLHASGYRPEKLLQHFRTIAAIQEVLGVKKADAVAYLELCRVKRNTVEYDMAGIVSESEAIELIDFTKQFRTEVLDWLIQHHHDLVPLKLLT